MKVSVRQQWYWRGMDQDIEAYVSSCLGCQLAKAKVSKRHATHGHRLVSNIFNMFSMDLVDMSTVSQSYRYLLVLQDYYSGFTILTNLRSKRASGVIKALWDALSLFGPPQALLTDNGKEFINSLVNNLVETEQIQHVTTFPYHAQGNAKNERSHQVIRQALRTFTEKQPHKWRLFTKKLQYMLNSRPNAHTGISPYEILFAVKPRPLYNTTPFLEFDQEVAQQARAQIKEMVDEIQLYKAQKAAEHEPPVPLQVGQKVIVVRGPSPNAVTPGQGPYRITRLIGSTGASKGRRVGAWRLSKHQLQLHLQNNQLLLQLKSSRKKMKRKSRSWMKKRINRIAKSKKRPAKALQAQSRKGRREDC